MYTITDHNSDVYGITLHPARPFLFASCSRDTTIRLFSIDGLVSSLKMQLLHDSKIDNSKNQIFDTPQATYDQKGTYKLCAQNSSKLIQRTSIQDFKSELSGLTTMYDFVQFSEGQPELLNCIEVLSSDL
jgi:WD40 repeat protein